MAECAPSCSIVCEILDEELSRLPDHYRGAIVLCDLECLTRKETARQLGIPEGSVASRLARARVMLAKRLTQRGVVFSGRSLAAVLASAPPAVLASTIKAASLLAAGQATGVVSAKVAALTEGVVRSMFVTKIKSVLTVVLVLGGIGLVVGHSTNPAAVAQQPGALPDAGKEQKAKETRALGKEEKLRVLIDKVLAAHGGEDTLNKLTSFTMTVKHSNGETQHYFVQPPKNFRWETTHRDRTGKRIVILFPDGRRWWRKEPNEDAKKFFPTGAEAPVAYWLDYVKFFGPRQLLRLKDADHKVALLDEEVKIGDRAAVGMEVTRPNFNRKLFPAFNRKMYFDKETHLLLKSGAVTYSDYKTFEGIPVAQKEHDGYFEPEVTDFRAVEKFDAKLFEQP